MLRFRRVVNRQLAEFVSPSPSERRSEVEGEEGLIVGADTGGSLQQVDQGLSLSGEAVHHILRVVSNWCLEEEGQVGKDGTKGLVIDLHSREKLSKNDHVDHNGDGQKRVLTDVIWWNSVDTIHENLRWVLIKSTLWVSDERNILNNNLMVNVVLALRVEDGVWFNGVIKDTSLGDLLWLEAFVFREVLSIVVTKMVVRNNTSKAETSTNKEITHDSLEPGLSWLEVATSQKSSLLTGILDNSWVESVLRRTVQVKDAFLNSSNAVKDRSSEWLVVLDASMKFFYSLDLWKLILLGVSCP